MSISIIAAMAKNRVIGKDNQLPWRLPADLKHFRKLTMGKPIIMGRKTYESIGKPLDGRKNIIITNNLTFQAVGCTVTYSLAQAFDAIENDKEVMVIGGASFYEQVLAIADRLYLTLIHQDFDGDAFFPDISNNDWLELERTDCNPDDKNPYAYSFVTLERK